MGEYETIDWWKRDVGGPMALRKRDEYPFEDEEASTDAYLIARAVRLRGESDD